uniref:Uncharacterized protein n=1 Tax=Chrysemys picta bellii TaxID=8478 RepID=A0A8C3HZJ3_CHRPI
EPDPPHLALWTCTERPILGAVLLPALDCSDRRGEMFSVLGVFLLIQSLFRSSLELVGLPRPPTFPQPLGCSFSDLGPVDAQGAEHRIYLGCGAVFENFRCQQ